MSSTTVHLSPSAGAMVLLLPAPLQQTNLITHMHARSEGRSIPTEKTNTTNNNLQPIWLQMNNSAAVDRPFRENNNVQSMPCMHVLCARRRLGEQ